MSYKNKIDIKSIRRRCRAEHVPQICLAGRNSFGTRLERKLKTAPAAKLVQIVKRCGRRAAALLGSNDLEESRRAQHFLAVGNLAATIYTKRLVPVTKASCPNPSISPKV